MNRNRVWIIDDDQSIRWVLERAFQRAGIDFDSFESAEEAIGALESSRTPDAVISDVRMSGMTGIELLALLKEQHNSTPPVIIMTAHADLETAVSAYDSGAFEYLPKPFDVDEVIDITRRAFDSNRNTAKMTERPQPEHSGLIGETTAMQQVFRAIGRLSRSHATVLINGESGTGKELIARALHQHSARADKPFIALNMAAISHDLMESELFGHEKGAFTGASEQRHGRFEQADTGTLFLDEIGDMPAPLQTRLLRVLSENQFFRVGGKKPIKVDVRIVAATHQNLETLVDQQRFREDLFHRLNVIRITAPALRNRAADIPLLMKTFLQRAAMELGCEPKTSTEALDDHLKAMPWPGNVRQLENLARWLTVMASGRELRIDDLPDDLSADKDAEANTENTAWIHALKAWARAAMANKQPMGREATEAFERALIECALEQTGNRKQEAATLLGWGRNTLTRKIKDYNIG
jgi:two-component system nitrogen regulation response regulator GlnG